MLSVVLQTHPGIVRATNEDAVLWDPALGLLAIADGMGGHNAGEVASRMALDVVQRSMASTASEAPPVYTPDPAVWPFGFSESQSLHVNRLRTAIRLANQRILKASTDHVEYAGMGTTLIVVLIEDARVWFASIGDSRLYTKASDNAALQQRTRDDSFVGLLRDTPGVAPAVLVDHPMRHLLTNVVGPRADLSVRVEELALEEGSLLLLCTDGLHGDVGDEVIDAILDGSEAGDLQVAADHLVEAALGTGGRDNITLALARYSAES